MKAVSLFFLWIIFFVSCSGTSSETDDNFGSDYDLLTTSELPSIQNDSLITMVSYGGCNTNHSFMLKSKSSSNRKQLWLFKQTPDQLCDMLVQERQAFKLSEKVLRASSVILLQPGGKPIILR